ncbi:TRAP-type uncharacterized transport system fused permease subunit [Lachnospiraceae bacterium PF1-21]|uniref:hypothetical protein n=1 Tax=Ohessyouella blattaphilus TaxID=2949333 RepID=UPI003E2562EE
MKKIMAMVGSGILSVIQLFLMLFHAVGLLSGTGQGALMLWLVLEALVLLILGLGHGTKKGHNRVRKK